jgi:hypothetical protein
MEADKLLQPKSSARIIIKLGDFIVPLSRLLMGFEEQAVPSVMNKAIRARHITKEGL